MTVKEGVKAVQLKKSKPAQETDVNSISTPSIAKSLPCPPQISDLKASHSGELDVKPPAVPSPATSTPSPAATNGASNPMGRRARAAQIRATLHKDSNRPRTPVARERTKSATARDTKASRKPTESGAPSKQTSRTRMQVNAFAAAAAAANAAVAAANAAAKALERSDISVEIGGSGQSSRRGNTATLRDQAGQSRGVKSTNPPNPSSRGKRPSTPDTQTTRHDPQRSRGRIKTSASTSRGTSRDLGGNTRDHGGSRAQNANSPLRRLLDHVSSQSKKYRQPEISSAKMRPRSPDVRRTAHRFAKFRRRTMDSSTHSSIPMWARPVPVNSAMASTVTTSEPKSEVLWTTNDSAMGTHRDLLGIRRRTSRSLQRPPLPPRSRTSSTRAPSRSPTPLFFRSLQSPLTHSAIGGRGRNRRPRPSRSTPPLTPFGTTGQSARNAYNHRPPQSSTPATPRSTREAVAETKGRRERSPFTTVMERLTRPPRTQPEPLPSPTPSQDSTEGGTACLGQMIAALNQEAQMFDAIIPESLKSMSVEKELIRKINECVRTSQKFLKELTTKGLAEKNGKTIPGAPKGNATPSSTGTPSEVSAPPAVPKLSTKEKLYLKWGSNPGDNTMTRVGSSYRIKRESSLPEPHTSSKKTPGSPRATKDADQPPEKTLALLKHLPSKRESTSPQATRTPSDVPCPSLTGSSDAGRLTSNEDKKVLEITLRSRSIIKISKSSENNSKFDTKNANLETPAVSTQNASDEVETVNGKDCVGTDTVERSAENISVDSSTIVPDSTLEAAHNCSKNSENLCRIGSLSSAVAITETIFSSDEDEEEESPSIVVLRSPSADPRKGDVTNDSVRRKEAKKASGRRDSVTLVLRYTGKSTVADESSSDSFESFRESVITYSIHPPPLAPGTKSVPAFVDEQYDELEDRRQSESAIPRKGRRDEGPAPMPTGMAVGMGSASPASPRALVATGKAMRKSRHLPAVGGLMTPPLSSPNNPCILHAPGRGRRHHSRAHGVSAEGNVCYACGRWRNEMWDSCGGSGSGGGGGGGGMGSRKGKRSLRPKATSATNLVSSATQTTSLMEALAEAAAMGTDATQCIKQLLVPLLCDPGQCRLCECEVVQRLSADPTQKKSDAKPTPKFPDKIPAGDASASLGTSSLESKQKGLKHHCVVADHAAAEKEDTPSDQTPLTPTQSPSSQLLHTDPHSHKSTKSFTKYTTCPLLQRTEYCSSNDGDASSNNRLTSPSTTYHDAVRAEEEDAMTTRSRREATFIVSEDRVSERPPHSRSQGTEDARTGSHHRGGDASYARRPLPDHHGHRKDGYDEKISGGSASSLQERRSREGGDERARCTRELGRSKRGRTTDPARRCHDDELFGGHEKAHARRGHEYAQLHASALGPRRRPRERPGSGAKRQQPDAVHSMRVPSGTLIRHPPHEHSHTERSPGVGYAEGSRHKHPRSRTRLKAKHHHRDDGKRGALDSPAHSTSKLVSEASKSKLDSHTRRSERSLARRELVHKAMEKFHAAQELRESHRRRYSSQARDEAARRRDAAAAAVVAASAAMQRRGESTHAQTPSPSLLLRASSESPDVRASREEHLRPMTTRRSSESVCPGASVRGLSTPARMTHSERCPRSDRDTSAPPAPCYPSSKTLLLAHAPRNPGPAPGYRSGKLQVFTATVCQDKPTLTSSLDMSDRTLSYASALSVSTSTPLRTSSSRDMTNLSPPESISEAHPKEYVKCYRKRVPSVSGGSSSAKDTSSVMSGESASEFSRSSTDLAAVSPRPTSNYDQGDAVAVLRTTTERACMTSVKIPPKRKPPWRPHKQFGRKGFPPPPPVPRRSALMKSRHSQPPPVSTPMTHPHTTTHSPTPPQSPTKVGKGSQSSACTPPLPAPPPSPNTCTSQSTRQSTDVLHDLLTKQRLFDAQRPSKMRVDVKPISRSSRNSPRASRRRSRTGSRMGSPRTYSMTRCGAGTTCVSIVHRHVSTPPPSRGRKVIPSESSSSTDSEDLRTEQCMMVPTLSPVFPPYPCPFVQSTSHAYMGAHLPSGAIFPDNLPVPFLVPTEEHFIANFPGPFPRHPLPETFLKTPYGGFVWEAPTHTATLQSQEETEDESERTGEVKKSTNEKKKSSEGGKSPEKGDERGRGRNEKIGDGISSRKQSRTRVEVAVDMCSGEESEEINMLVSSIDSGNRVVAESSSSNSNGWGPTNSSISEDDYSECVTPHRGSPRHSPTAPPPPKTPPKSPTPQLPVPTPPSSNPPSEPQPTALCTSPPTPPVVEPTPTTSQTPPPSVQQPSQPPEPTASAHNSGASPNPAPSRSGVLPIPPPATAPVRSCQREGSRSNNRKRFRGCLTPAAMAAAATRAAAAAGQARRKLKESEDNSPNRWQR